MELTEKEIERRKKISIARKKAIEEKRIIGYQNYLKRKRKEKERRKLLAEKEKLAKKRLFIDSEGTKVKKRKVGRPKKRGPKKKHKYVSKKVKIDGRTCSSYKRTIDYKVIKCRNGVQTEYIGSYVHKDDAYKVFNEIIKQSDEIVFPRIVKNNGKIGRINDECLLLVKNRDGSLENNFLRNEYGKLVEQKTTSPTWVILDKSKIYVEETFWVFGRNPIKERVTFMWVYNHLIQSEDVINRTGFIRIIQYKNKLVIKHDDNNLDIVFCKTEGDCIRMYNLIEEMVTEDKYKNVLFLGSYSKISDKRRKFEEELCDFTGFSKAKIQLSVTKNCKR